LKEILDWFCDAMGMLINDENSAIFFSEFVEEERVHIQPIFSFSAHDIGEGVKYLGFVLKPNNYGKADWRWLIAHIEKRISCWCNRWISCGQLTLVKSVLEVILVYWHLLAYIPKGVLTSIRKICFNYLWKNSVEFLGSHLVAWKQLSKPKSMGGWGLKDLYSFGKALAKNLYGFSLLETTCGGVYL
jgi:hypothetical protein